MGEAPEHQGETVARVDLTAGNKHFYAGFGGNYSRGGFFRQQKPGTWRGRVYNNNSYRRMSGDWNGNARSVQTPIEKTYWIRRGQNSQGGSWRTSRVYSPYGNNSRGTSQTGYGTRSSFGGGFQRFANYSRPNSVRVGEERRVVNMLDRSRASSPSPYGFFVDSSSFPDEFVPGPTSQGDSMRLQRRETSRRDREEDRHSRSDFSRSSSPHDRSSSSSGSSSPSYRRYREHKSKKKHKCCSCRRKDRSRSRERRDRSHSRSSNQERTYRSPSGSSNKYSSRTSFGCQECKHRDRLGIHTINSLDVNPFADVEQLDGGFSAPSPDIPSLSSRNNFTPRDSIERMLSSSPGSMAGTSPGSSLFDSPFGVPLNKSPSTYGLLREDSEEWRFHNPFQTPEGESRSPSPFSAVQNNSQSSSLAATLSRSPTNAQVKAISNDDVICLSSDDEIEILGIVNTNSRTRTLPNAAITLVRAPLESGGGTATVAHSGIVIEHLGMQSHSQSQSQHHSIARVSDTNPVHRNSQFSRYSRIRAKQNAKTPSLLRAPKRELVRSDSEGEDNDVQTENAASAPEMPPDLDYDSNLAVISVSELSPPMDECHREFLAVSYHPGADKDRKNLENRFAACYREVEKFSDYMMRAVHRIEQRAIDAYLNKSNFTSTLREIAREEFNDNIELLMVGSTQNNLAVRESDLDLCLITRDKHGRLEHQKSFMKRRLEVFASRLRRDRRLKSIEEGLGGVEVVHARVSIIRLHSLRPRMQIDINCNNVIGVYNTNLIYLYTKTDRRFKVLGILLKKWAAIAGINDAKEGTLNSYALSLLLIHFLQCGVKPAVLPNLQTLRPKLFDKRIPPEKLATYCDPDLLDLPSAGERSNLQCVAELLIGFFEYYRRFDFDNLAISIEKGRYIKRTHFGGEPIVIYEPFDETMNVARCVTAHEGITAIRKAIRRASRYFSRSPSKWNLDGFFEEVASYRK